MTAPFALDVGDGSLASKSNPFPTGSYDAGPAWVQRLGVTSNGVGQTVSSADASSTALVITDAPPVGATIVLDDLEVSTDTNMTLTLRTTTTHFVIGKYPVTANSPVQITNRGKKRSPTPGQTLELLASVAGNIYCTPLYHFEQP